MSRQARYLLGWLIATTVGWAAAWGGGEWMSRMLFARRIVPNGFVGLVVAALSGVILITILQWWSIRDSDTNLILWFLATGVGLFVGLPGAYLGYALSLSQPGGGALGLPLFPEVDRSIAILITASLGSAPGGFVSSILQRFAVKRGRVVHWIPISTFAWGLAFGVGGLVLFFLNSEFRTLQSALKTLIAGGSAGLVHALILGPFLSSLLHEDREVNGPQ